MIRYRLKRTRYLTMGIKGLCQFIEKIDPKLIIEIPITQFSGHHLAIDVSIYMYKFISIHNKLEGNWIDMFIKFIIWMRKNNIRPVFVFDGDPPPQKTATQMNRRNNRQNSEQNLSEIEEAIDELSTREKITDPLKEKIKKILGSADIKDLSQQDLSRKLHALYKRLNGRCIHIGIKEIQKVQNLLTYMGLPWLQATGEAERSCAWLCKYGYVTGVITTDSDVLAYGAPLFIKDFKANVEICKFMYYDYILDALDLTPEQFRDLCIMCGTDYNKNIKNIGPVTAYKLLQECGDIESIGKKGVSIGSLLFMESRKLFTLPSKDESNKIFKNIPENELFKIPAITKVDTGNMIMFLIKNNSYFSIEELENCAYLPKYIIKE